jgi:hypothetical protein
MVGVEVAVEVIVGVKVACGLAGVQADITKIKIVRIRPIIRVFTKSLHKDTDKLINLFQSNIHFYQKSIETYFTFLNK